MRRSLHVIGTLLSIVTVFCVSGTHVRAQEIHKALVAYKMTDIEGFTQFRRRNSTVELRTAGTGSLSTFNQRASEYRKNQRLKQEEEIQRRQFQENRIVAPRATEPPRTVIDNARIPRPNRRTGRTIDDPRLYLQQLREQSQVNRTVNAKTAVPDGPCASFSGAQLAKCMNEEQRNAE